MGGCCWPPVISFDKFHVHTLQLYHLACYPIALSLCFNHPPTGAGLADVSCRVIGEFEKPSGTKPPERMPYELLMALGTKPTQ